MRTSPVLQEVSSHRWDGAGPTVSVVIATHDRASFLPELLDRLERLQPPEGGFEVVVVDDGSTDATWHVLTALATATPLPLLALRVPASGGPSVPRNTGVLRSRGEVVAFTDDDCLPQPGWLRAVAAVAGESVAQGRTLPAPEGPQGPWDRSISVTGVSGLYETCNLAMPRAAFLAAEGFPLLDVVRGRARGFGEDVVLGHRAAALCGVRACPDAVVVHRWVRTSFAEHLEGRRRLTGFPLLTRQVPALRRDYLFGLFLSSRTAAADVAVVGLLARRRGGVLLALPWLLQVLRDARARPGRPLLLRAGQIALADAVALASLAEGSVRSRTPVL